MAASGRLSRRSTSTRSITTVGQHVAQLKAGGIERDAAARGRQPEPSVVALPSRWLAAAVAFVALHPVAHAESDAGHRPGAPFGDFVEVAPADPGDPFVARHPEMAAIVLEGVTRCSRTCPGRS